MTYPLPVILFLIFLVLKLTSIIDWSWWWVTAPLWGGLALALAFVFGAAALEAAIEARRTPAQRAARAARELSDRLRRQ